MDEPSSIRLRDFTYTTTREVCVRSSSEKTSGATPSLGATDPKMQLLGDKSKKAGEIDLVRQR